MTASIRDAARALHGDVAGRNRILIPGPGHSLQDRSLSVTFTQGGFVCHSFAGDDFRECRDHVKAALGVSDDRPAFADVTPPHFEPDRLRKQRSAAEIWAQSTQLAGTIAETYLASRGLSYDGDALRFYPRSRAMVAIITDAVTGEHLGIHRTFLNADGQKIGRKMLGAAAGGVVRLSSDEDVTTAIGIAEGIETALAAPYRPVWATLSAGTMRTFPVMPGIETLTIFADHDPAGIEAANACGEKWHAAGVEVSVAQPDELGADFADLREAA